ncbi:hypothetical protein [Microbacterium maritypicum]|uniref:Uncharacterized protein n=2 Tax=Microbacterium maritypicum TaxID=33918 RepID=A0ACD4B8K2_MICMQ|nr:hypothetical protein [Microbacterium liquefaciens]UTT53802.1 hypothetical protein NMQ05_04265 [Microbacterium liquefaciens]UTT53868.1 hypothetical protein NMQ05_04600 [Microbacterium liquefaciens]
MPPHYLLGAVVNMSAEGIAAAEAGYHRNLSARKKSIGEGYELAMRTAAAMLGDESAAVSTTDQVEWENVSSWSLSQVSDFVQKIESITGPLEPLFRMVPGWTKTDAATAVTAAEKRTDAIAAAAAARMSTTELAARTATAPTNSPAPGGDAGTAPVETAGQPTTTP